MAGLAALALPIANIATIGGAAVSAIGTLAGGRAQQRAANYEAAQLDVKGKEEQAAARHEADQLRRRRDLALSSLTARSAASGLSATDPTTLALGEDITRYGTVQEQMAMYGGTSRKQGREAQADVRRAEGEAARTGSYWRAAGSILGGVSTIADRYRPPRATSSGSGLYYG